MLDSESGLGLRIHLDLVNPRAEFAVESTAPHVGEGQRQVTFTTAVRSTIGRDEVDRCHGCQQRMVQLLGVE